MKNIKRIYIGKYFLPKFPHVVMYNDGYFNKIVSDKELLKTSDRLIADIDAAKIIDYDLLTIKTTFGITDIYNFSTGLKTILNVLYLSKHENSTQVLVNIGECGDMAVNTLLRLNTNSNICFYLTHSICIDEDSFEEVDYYINDVQVYDVFSAIEVMCKYVGDSLL